MKTKFTILSKLKPSFKGWVYIIVILFFIPFICVFINYSTSLYFGDLYTFGISERKDFFTVWIALFGAIGIAFNIYQNQKRTKNQEEQLEKQQAQIELQRKSQCDSRFSKGIELLGNENESVRTGAAYSLCFLAKDFSDEFSKPVFDILCSHIRTLTTSEDYLKKHSTVSNEVQTILNLLFKGIDGNNTTSFSNYKADLRGAHLEGAHLKEAKLIYAYLQRAHLKRAFLVGANLEAAELGEADLVGACLAEANLTYTNLMEANLQETNLRGTSLDTTFLMKADLSKAYIYPSMRPFLEKQRVDLTDINWVDF